ncbi:recombinase family protein [Bacillus cereus]|uniref:Recombinase family protein n=2 Tax=Bacillus cereus TaxID=1396 RepID=A0A1Q4L0G3_BACCE|nr:recombinase family protein [Bacillus cereus]OKA30435.1 hypothetical protein BJR07_30110 [Bacillus cereus]OKA35554.1 hypothetical protein BJR06_16535 [Bacillus cereus]
MKCAIYRRVSTDEQAEKGFSLENQLLRLQAFAESQGWEVVHDYMDDGYSGKNMNRPQIKRMLHDLKLNKFDIVLVYRLDRFTRSVKDLNDLLEVFKDHEVDFKSATESIDTATATGRMILNMMVSTAQWERETISERVKDVVRKKKDLGLISTGYPPYGYAMNDGVISQVPHEVEIVKFIFEKAKVYGFQKISKLLNEQGLVTRNGTKWLISTASRIAHNPFYSGEMRYKRDGETSTVPINVEGYEPVITKEEHRDVLKAIKKRNRNQTRSKSNEVYPFSGIVLCPECGHPMKGTRVSSRGYYYKYYRCDRAQDHFCDGKLIRSEKVDKAFVEYLRVTFKVDRIEIKEETNTKDIEREIKRCKSKIERLKDLYVDGDISKKKYKNDVDELNEKIYDLEQKLLSAENKISHDHIRENLKRISELWEHIDDQTKTESIRGVMDTMTIEIQGKDVVITSHTLL